MGLKKRYWWCWLISAMSTLAPTLGFTNFSAQNWTMDNGHAVWLLFWKNALGRAFLVPAGFQGFSHELHLVRSRDCPHTNMLGHRQHHHPQPLAKTIVISTVNIIITNTVTKIRSTNASIDGVRFNRHWITFFWWFNRIIYAAKKNTSREAFSDNRGVCVWLLPGVIKTGFSTITGFQLFRVLFIELWNLKYRLL